jgi:hypothetical protein
MINEIFTENIKSTKFIKKCLVEYIHAIKLSEFDKAKTIINTCIELLDKKIH